MKQLNYALCLTLFTSAAWCQQQSVRHDNDGSDDLQIVVIQGEDGANIVQDGTFADTIVEVRDRNNVPIVGGRHDYRGSRVGPGRTHRRSYPRRLR